MSALTSYCSTIWAPIVNSYSVVPLNFCIVKKTVKSELCSQISWVGIPAVPITDLVTLTITFTFPPLIKQGHLYSLIHRGFMRLVDLK